MAKIQVKQGESIEEALRRFNREVLKEGIMQELRRREFRVKPSKRKYLDRRAKEKQREYEGKMMPEEG